MAIPIHQLRTIDDAGAAVSMMKARLQLAGTAMADALAEAQAAQPGALERISRILGKARDEHLVFLKVKA
jgi:hypothetical protein